MAWLRGLFLTACSVVLACSGDASVASSGGNDGTGTSQGDDGGGDGASTAASGDETADGTAEGGECSMVVDPACDDDDPCTVDECISQTCAYSPSPDGTACEGPDGAAGTCQDGSCAVDCEVDDDCDDDNPCTLDSCDVAVGQCAFADLDGVDAMDQVVGDCVRVVCESGQPYENPDTSDVPVDDNDCTADECRGSSPANDPLGAGTECGVDGICDGSGACVDCIGPADCTDLPQDDDCQTRTCVAGVCGQDFAKAGTEVNATLQTNGDCRLVVCDGEGDMDYVDDDDDPYVDGLECTEDLCNSGLTFNPPLDAGEECAAGVCNAGGQCVGCLVPADCGGDNTFCQTVTCIGNVCGVSNTAAGLPLPAGSQTANDCQELVCDGGGSVQAAADDDDLPLDDGNDCTDEACSNGVQLHPDEPLDTPCDDGDGVCDGAGTCGECNEADQCDAAGACEVEACVDHVCAPTPGAPGGSCNDGLFCTANDACDGDGECVGTGSPCSGPDGDGNCSESCNEATDSCNADDPGGSACDDGLYCTNNDTCNGVGTCVGGGSPCPGPDGDGNCSESCDEGADNCLAPDPPGTTCTDGLFCTSGDACGVGGTCVAGAANPCPGPDGDSDCSESCDEFFNNCAADDTAGSACTDNLYCNGTDTCNATGGCTVHAGNPCTPGNGDSDCSESCNETTDACTSNDPVGSACGDGVYCNGADTCNASGGCTVHAGNPCPGPDNDSDCSESCNETTDQCTANDGAGAACNDGLYCNGPDACTSGGNCTVHAGNPCPGPDGDSDCSEVCNEAQNNCSSNDPSGTACNDGAYCNGTDTCNGSGSCSNHSGNPCPGADDDCDCSETCNESSNNCSNDDPNGSICGFGLCSSGTCIGICF